MFNMLEDNLPPSAAGLLWRLCYSLGARTDCIRSSAKTTVNRANRSCCKVSKAQLKQVTFAHLETKLGLDNGALSPVQLSMSVRD